MFLGDQYGPAVIAIPFDHLRGKEVASLDVIEIHGRTALHLASQHQHQEESMDHDLLGLLRCSFSSSVYGHMGLFLGVMG